MFSPGANNGESTPTDTILVSADSVFFYVHGRRLLAVSSNRFNNTISESFEERTGKDPELVIPLPHPSPVLNILMHTVYNKGCAHFTPSLADLSLTLNILETYGMLANILVAPGMPLYDNFRLHASQDALELYTVAAAHNLYDLAVYTSAHLLSLPLHSISDDHASRMGTYYLKKLFFLHLGRADALKRLLLPSPRPHTPAMDCNMVEQKKVSRAWALACAYLTWDMRVDLAIADIEAALSSLESQVSCTRCKLSLRERVDTLTAQWSLVRVCTAKHENMTLF